ncbi:MAG: alpha/beta hydrolase-fold protein [Chloroflexota bacterium]
MTPRQPPGSPRLQALYHELEAGDTYALDAFWYEIRGKGAPLVEDIEGSGNEVLVTFLWRANDSITNVFIFGGPAEQAPMTRLGDTDLWYRSYHIRSDARFTYELGPTNQPVPENPAGWDPNLAMWQTDPLNPEQCTYPHDPEGSFFGYTASLVELPNALPQPWLKPTASIPAGKTDLVRYQSQLLNNTRRVWVYTPPAVAEPSDPYNLLILFDGFVYSQVIPTATILDNLLAVDKIKPTVAVMIDPVDRASELDGSQQFTTFLVDEFLPWIRECYPVTDAAVHTTIGGSSMGGLAALYTALERPDVFGNVISQSGAFWFGNPDNQDWFVAKVANEFQPSPEHLLSIYMDVGLYEPINLHINRKMRDVLQQKKMNIEYSEVSRTHEPLSWQEGLMEVLSK